MEVDQQPVQLIGGTPQAPAPGALQSPELAPNGVYEATFGVGALPYFVDADPNPLQGALMIE